MISCSMGWVILYLFHGRVGDVIPYVNLEKNARSCTVLLLTSPTHFHLFRLRSINFHWFLCYSVLRQTTGSVRTNIYDNTYNRYKRYSGYKRCTYTLIHYRISEFIQVRLECIWIGTNNYLTVLQERVPRKSFRCFFFSLQIRANLKCMRWTVLSRIRA